MLISAIVAKSTNNVIGLNNELPWHLPGDLKWFKEKTIHKHVIMGRKSFQSLSKPLVNRTNIIVTSNPEFFHSKCVIVSSIEDGLSVAHKNNESEVFILGGGTIYEQTKGIWDRLYLTEVDIKLEGDTFFPEIDYSRFNLIFEKDNPKDSKNVYSYTFRVFEKKRARVI